MKWVTRSFLSGETVTAAVIEAPDKEWAPRLESLLQHKGDPWNWKNTTILRQPTGVAARFFILHRGGKPFAHIMLAETGGVALLGHVWTNPNERRKGASSWLINKVLTDFTHRGGQAIFLGTEFDSVAWHFYRRHGFIPIEPGSGYMGWWLDWPHWISTAPLFLIPMGGTVRLANCGLWGRMSSERPLLQFLREQSDPQPAMAYLARLGNSAAVVGFSCRRPHPLWPIAGIIDLFCHPHRCHCAQELLPCLPITKGQRTLAYSDAQQLEKRTALAAAGFREVTQPSQGLPPAANHTDRIDVSICCKYEAK